MSTECKQNVNNDDTITIVASVGEASNDGSNSQNDKRITKSSRSCCLPSSSTIALMSRHEHMHVWKSQIVNEHTLLGSFIHVLRLTCMCVHAYSSVPITKSQAANVMATSEIQLVAWISTIQIQWDTIWVSDFFLLHTPLPSCAHIKEAFSSEQKDLDVHFTSCEPELCSRTQLHHRSTHAIHVYVQCQSRKKKMRGHATKTKINQASTDNHVKFIQVSNIQISPPILSHMNCCHKQLSRGSRLAISPCPKPLCSNKSAQCGRSWRFPVDQSATRVFCTHYSGKSTCYCALVVSQFIYALCGGQSQFWPADIANNSFQQQRTDLLMRVQKQSPAKWLQIIFV